MEGRLWVVDVCEEMMMDSSGGWTARRDLQSTTARMKSVDVVKTSNVQWRKDKVIPRRDDRDGYILVQVQGL